jgi:hypothetical protein
MQNAKENESHEQGESEESVAMKNPARQMRGRQK